MPSPLDVAFAILFAVVVATAMALYFDPRFKRQVAAGVPTARRNAYRRTVAGQLVFAVLAVALWGWERRAWGALGLALPHGWRLAVGALLVVIVLVFVVRQNAAVRRMSAERIARIAPKVAELEFMLPHTTLEYRWFLALSWTAGIVEELLYRGFLTWLIASYIGLPAAVLIAAAAFGLAHAYQGARGIIKTGAVGLAMGLIVLASGWLVPAMVIHALIDVMGGVLGFAVLGARESAESAHGDAAIAERMTPT